jgi:HK97 family phage prohead protease
VSEIIHSPPLRITEIKASDGSMEVAGYVSTFLNRDFGGDIVQPGAFTKTLSEQSPVRFLYGHDSHSVLGKPLELRADDKGLFGRFAISQTQLGKDVHTLLKDGALDSFSIGYIPTDVDHDEHGNRLLKAVDLLECSVVAMPMNAHATVTAVKEQNGEGKAVWSTAYMNNLPDSAFAAIEGGGKKDDEGKTVPRSLRHYPHHDVNGKLDLVHLRNALSRIGDPSNYQGGKAHLAAHARAAGIGGDNSSEKLSEFLGEFGAETDLDDLIELRWLYSTLAREAGQLVEQHSHSSDDQRERWLTRLELVRRLEAHKNRRRTA